ncbi:MAG: DJ-1/PfpI family protein [Candidatus Izemoplasmatales bacterium]|nr:DJ-1/PfpI family protein [Candidatus Izemoplasmatales bacterium]MDY0139390.1 DJ-1/PfpI family protein [Candidatus Izemoplasmatales bacterium]
MRLACLLADGFEDIEALGTSALLRRAGFEVDFFSVYNDKYVEGSYKTIVAKVNKMKKLIVDDYDGIFIPGGKAAFIIREIETVRQIVKDFNDKNKWMLSICAGPTVFGLTGIMDGVKYISFPGTEREMGKAIRVEQKAVSDGKFITAKSAGAIYDFVFEIIKTINGEKALEEFKDKLYF